MELNIRPTTLQNESGTTFFEIKSANVINILGNLGIGTDIPLSDFHIENVQFDDKILQIPTASNIYNYLNPEKVYSLVPTGSIIIYPSDNTDRINRLNRQGWYECNGQTLLGSNFPVLSKVLAGQFGNTDPVSTYITLPDFRDKVGIGSTVVGYISPEDPVLYASPSNLYNNTVISSINNGYTFPLSYTHLPNHKHAIDFTGPPIEPGAAGSGDHRHTYRIPNRTTNFLSANNTVDRGGGSVNMTTLVNVSPGGSGTSAGKDPIKDSGTGYGAHTHGTFDTDLSGTQSILNLTNGTYTAGPTLTGTGISIRQASIYMLSFIKCL